LIVALVAITLVAIAVAVSATRGREVINGQASVTTIAAAPSSTSSPTTTTTIDANTLAQGCLGGSADLDQSVLAAQDQAPLTREGAAAFAATVIRWAMTAPPPAFQAFTAQRVLTPGANESARRLLTSGIDLQGTKTTVSFNKGRYLVESYQPTEAVVSYLAEATAQQGTGQGKADISGSVHLVAVNGQWRFDALTGERPLEEIQRLGTPYKWGC
jgi:hypothetical protein